ncbi:MAG: hypothetical protein IPP07_13020 [Holophagales bacterium]|nr:hypothetical protein [Holophagales bacterium]
MRKFDEVRIDSQFSEKETPGPSCFRVASGRVRASIPRRSFTTWSYSTIPKIRFPSLAWKVSFPRKRGISRSEVSTAPTGVVIWCQYSPLAKNQSLSLRIGPPMLNE